MEIRKPMILVVEDDPSDRDLFLESLRQTRFNPEVFLVGDGLEALAYLKQVEVGRTRQLPDLIFLDLNLPGLDGKDVLQEIKNHPVLARIPVIIFSTSSSDQDILKTYDLHANCFVTKPASLELFFQTIQHIVVFWFETVRLPSRRE